MFVLIGWAILSLIGLIVKESQSVSAAIFAMVCGFVGLVAVLLGVFLGVIGLSEIRKQPGVYNQGFKQSLWSFLLAAFVLGLGVFGIVRHFVNLNRIQRTLVYEDQPQNGQVIEFRHENFSIASPGESWVRIDAKKLVEHGTVGFLRKNPEIYFIITTEVLGADAPISNDAVVETILGGVKASSTGFELLGRETMTLNGIPGIVIHNRASVGIVAFSYAHWISFRNGRVYHLVVYGTLTHEAFIQREAPRLFAGFHELDPNNVAETPGGSDAVSQYTSQRYRYSISLGKGWRLWTDVASSLPEAEFGAMHGSDTCLTIVSLQLCGIRSDFEAILSGVLELLQLKQENCTINLYTSTHWKGAIIEYSSRHLGFDFKHWLMPIQQDDLLILVHAWTSDTNKHSMIRQVLNSVRLDVGTWVNRLQMTPAEAQSSGLLLNNIGLVHMRTQRDPAKAAFCFEQAGLLCPQDPVIAENLIYAHLQNRQPRLARLAANAALKRFPDEPSLLCRAAAVAAEMGDFSAAAELYAKAFRGKYTDDIEFERYIGVLMKQNALDIALPAVQQYRQRSSSRTIAFLHASLLSIKEDHQKAINILEPLLKDAEFDPEVACLLGFQYNAVGRYGDGLKIAEQLKSLGHESSDSLLMRTQALVGLKNYREARITAENALRLSPNDPKCLDMVRYISALLGEGDYTLIREPIEPVAIPQEVIANIPDTPPKEAEDFGAYYIARVEAVKFVPGKELRTTELVRVRIVDQRGIEIFKEMERRFDPVNEALYVNSLEVRDASGRVIARGRSENCYVVDAPAGTTATHDKILHVPVSGLAPGCTMELIITRKEAVPPQRIRFTKHFFSALLPVQRSAVVVYCNTNLIIANASEGVSRQQLDGGVLWQVDDPQIFRPETSQVEPSKFLPTLTFGDSQAKWTQEADEYIEMIKDLLVPTPECISLAAELTRGLNDESLRLEAILKYVQANYVYNAIEFGRRSRIPQKPASIIENKYGDCKDHSLLAYHLLRAAGIDAHLVLINSFDQIDETIPSLEQFDHMIVCANINNEMRFFDCTDKETNVISSPPPELADRLALLLQPRQSRLVRLPHLPPDSNLFRSTRQITLDTSGNLAIRENLSITGSSAAYFRRYLKAVPVDDHGKVISQLLASAGVDVQITSVSVGQLLDVSSPLVIEMEYLLRSRFGNSDGVLVGTVPLCWERYLFLPEVSVDKRSSPLRMTFPTRFESWNTLRLPTGTKMKSMPSDGKVDTPYGSMQCNFSLEKESFVWHSTVRTPGGVCQISELRDYQQARQNLLSRMEPQLVIGKP